IRKKILEFKEKKSIVQFFCIRFRVIFYFFEYLKKIENCGKGIKDKFKSIHIEFEDWSNPQELEAFSKNWGQKCLKSNADINLLIGNIIDTRKKKIHVKSAYAHSFLLFVYSNAPVFHDREYIDNIKQRVPCFPVLFACLMRTSILMHPKWVVQLHRCCKRHFIIFN
ncbi:hypothetical protein RFI_28475, partial [Reticulomyxa filosa]